MNRLACRLSVFAGLTLMLGTVAHADYEVSPRSGGLHGITVQPGDSFVLDLVLTTDASDQLDGATFTVRFSEPGLRYDGYAWGAPFVPGFDNSNPKNGFPVTLGVSTYVAGSFDPGEVDVYFDAFSSTPFSTGTLLSLFLTVPEAYGSNFIVIDVVPDGFFLGAQDIPTTSGQFVLNIVPEPTSILLTLLGCAGIMSRRQRRVKPGV